MGNMYLPQESRILESASLRSRATEWQGASVSTSHTAVMTTIVQPATSHKSLETAMQHSQHQCNTQDEQQKAVLHANQQDPPSQL